MRPIVWGLLGSLALAPLPSAAKTSSRADAMFDFLTRADWVAVPERRSIEAERVLPRNVQKLRFLRTGSFRKWSYSDVPEEDLRGRWNFDLHDEKTGRIFVGGHSIYHFKRRGALLVFAGQVYKTVARDPSIVDRPECDLDSLDPIAAPDVLRSLCVHEWVHEASNPSDSYLTMRFEEQLRFRASRSRGDESGQFSIEQGRLIRELEPNLPTSRWAPLRVSEAFALARDTLSFHFGRYVAPAAGAR